MTGVMAVKSGSGSMVRCIPPPHPTSLQTMGAPVGYPHVHAEKTASLSIAYKRETSFCEAGFFSFCDISALPAPNFSTTKFPHSSNSRFGQ